MASITWTGAAGDDNYNNPANWSPAQVPGAGDTVTINPATAVSIGIPIPEAVASLTVGKTVTLNLSNNSTYTIGSGANAATFSNAGTFALNSSNSNTDLVVGGAKLTLSGTGTILLGNNGNNRIYGAAASDQLINTSNTIAGGGQLGAGQLKFTNSASGTVDANQPTTLILNTGTNTVTNAGLLEATAGGALAIQSTVSDGTTGHVTANGGNVYLQNATLQGGTLSTAAGGVVAVQYGYTAGLDGSANAVTNTGTFAIQNNGTLSILGSIVNQGQIALQSTNSATELVIAGPDVVLSGGGTVAMSDNGNNYIFGTAGTNLLDNVNNTIAGSGQLGDGALTLINEAKGLIDATGAGARLYLNTGSTVTTNSGLIEDTGTAGLQINSAVNNGSSGVILASGAGAFVALDNGGTIAGGTLATSNGGLNLVEYGNIATLDGTAHAVTNSGTFYVTNNASLSVLGTLINTGAVDLLSTNATTELTIGTPTVTLTGGGAVTLSDNGNNYIFGSVAADVLDNVNNTISGAGQLGDGQLTFINEAGGTVNATGGNALVINTSGEVVKNSGLIEATGAGGLVVQSTTIDSSSGGTILASNGNVYLNGSVLAGGTVKTAGTGNIIVSYGQGGTLDGSAHTITNFGTVAVQNNGTLSLLGTISNKNLITLGSTNASTDLIIGPGGNTPGTVTLTGSGTLTLSDNTNNRIYGAIAGDTLINLNNTISGAGQIGVNQLTLINDATINASGTGELLLQSSGTSIVNNGLLESTNTGGLVINSTTIGNASGTVSAAGGNVYLQSGTIQGGLVSTTGTGAIVVQYGNIGAFDGASAGTLTTSGSVDVNNNGTLSLLGTIANTGTIALQSTNASTDLIIGDNTGSTVTLTGSGTIALSDNGNNRIYGAIGGDTLVNLNNTITGAGQIGAGQLTLINDSIIDASGQNALTIVTGGLSDINNGLLESTGSGGLVINSSTISNTSGTIAAAGGNVYLQSSTIAGGLLTGSGGASFNVQYGNIANLDGSAHALTNRAAVDVNNNGTLTLAGAIVNTGSINLQSTNASTDLILESSTVTLSGNGTITLSDNGSNRIYGAAAADVLDNVNNTIEGSGQLGAGQLTLTNGGTIAATGGNALIINLGSTGTNTATGQMLGEGTGGLIFQNGTYTNQGLIQADNGSTVTFQSGAVLTNDSASGVLTGGTYGAIATSNDATLAVSSGAAVNTLAADLILSGSGSEITFGGVLIETSLKTIAKGGELQVLGKRDYTTKNKLTNSGTVALGGGTLKAGGLSDKAGSVLTGFGTLNAKFTDAGSVVATGGELSLTGKTNSITGTVSGTGTVGFGGTTTLNAGTVLNVADIALLNKATLGIASSVSFAGTFNVVGTGTLSGAGTFTNTGLFEVAGKSAAGTVTDPFANAGTISVAAGDSLAFSGGLANTGLILDSGTFTDTTALTGGSLTLGGTSSSATIASTHGAGNSTLATLTTAGGALNTSGTTLTVTGDYNNTAAGTGNSYMPFAGVTGTIDGQGTQLSVVGVNGTTITSVNGTLTIAIKAGGTAQFEVENTGAAGSAALRGALQTTVNGGHITGTALSGSGVTASDFGPIAAGASSGIYTIAYSGGALTNESIHLTSDFANVAGLTIDIVAQKANAADVAPGPAAQSTLHPDISHGVLDWLPGLHHG